MSDARTPPEETYDVIVVGSGGGLIGAYVAASRGLRTLVIEKTEFVGGTTAYSGAGMWLPANAAERRAGAEDSVESARLYLDSIVGEDSPASLRDAFLAAGPQMIDELEENPRFQWFEYLLGVPDYFAGRPGSNASGRTIFPPDLPLSELGDLEPLLRKPVWTERWGTDPGPMASGGRALIARAMLAFTETGNGTIRTNTALDSLIVEDGRVVGVEAISDGTPVRFRAERGVLLAAGGFERNAELRQQYQPGLGDEWTMGCPGNTGQALEAGMAIGAATDLLEECWFAPGLVVPNNRPVFYTSVWSGIWVNGAGERFMNENLPYDQAGHELRRLHGKGGVSVIPARWIFDQKQIDHEAFGTYLSGVQPEVPGWFDVDKWMAAGVLVRADTLEELAEAIGVPAGALAKTVEEFNVMARAGVDEMFHRGEAPWDRFIVGNMGAPDTPNPCLQALEDPPYYCVQIVLSDLGTKGGLKTDEHARVVRDDGSVIPGLYASGNTMAPMSGRVYPGAGGPVGSSMTFSYIAALDMAGT